jgi:hypothetical protein
VYTPVGGRVAVDVRAVAVGVGVRRGVAGWVECAVDTGVGGVAILPPLDTGAAVVGAIVATAAAPCPDSLPTGRFVDPVGDGVGVAPVCSRNFCMASFTDTGFAVVWRA